MHDHASREPSMPVGAGEIGEGGRGKESRNSARGGSSRSGHTGSIVAAKVLGAGASGTWDTFL